MLTAGTIRTYISAVLRAAAARHGTDFTPPRALASLLARYADSDPLRYRVPLTRAVIRAVADDPDTPQGVRDAVLVGYHTGLRAGAYAARFATSTCVDSDLLRSDVSIRSAPGQPDIVALRIRHDKTNTSLNRGHVAVVVAYPSPSPYCPVRAVLRRLALPGPAHLPLFRAHDRHGFTINVTTHHVSAALKRHADAARPRIDPASVSSHSLRATAATLLQADGVSMTDLNRYIGWADPSGATSDRYVRVTTTLALRAHQALRLDVDDHGRPDPLVQRDSALGATPILPTSHADRVVSLIAEHISHRTATARTLIRAADLARGEELFDVPAARRGIPRFSSLGLSHLHARIARFPAVFDLVLPPLTDEERVRGVRLRETQPRDRPDIRAFADDDDDGPPPPAQPPPPPAGPPPAPPNTRPPPPPSPVSPRRRLGSR